VVLLVVPSLLLPCTTITSTSVLKSTFYQYFRRIIIIFLRYSPLLPLCLLRCSTTTTSVSVLLPLLVVLLSFQYYYHVYFGTANSTSSTPSTYNRYVLYFLRFFFTLYLLWSFIFQYYYYHYSTVLVLRSSLYNNNSSQMLFLIYINLEPFSVLILVFSILLCLAKLLNQYYYSFSGTCGSLFSTTILLTWYVYLLLLHVLPFLLLLLNCVFSYAFPTEPLVIFYYYSYYLHFSSPHSGTSTPYNYVLFLCGPVHMSLFTRKFYSAQCYSTTSYAPTTIVSMEPSNSSHFSFPGLPFSLSTLFPF
jgi:hypothetical protein